MKKKVFALLLSVSLLLCSCGSETQKGETQNSKPQEQTQNKNNDFGTENAIEEKDETVVIYVPVMNMDEDVTTEQFVQNMKDENKYDGNVEYAYYNEDFYTMTMKESQRQKLLKEAQKSINDKNEILKDINVDLEGNPVEFVVKYEFFSDYTRVNIFINQDNTTFMNVIMAQMMFYIYGVGLQSFSSFEPKELNVDIHYFDYMTEKEIDLFEE